jgi:hypothetical protein
VKIKAKAEGQVLVTVLAGMATDKVVCSRISSQWTKNLFGAPDAGLFAGWCIRHLRKYDEPIGGSIEQYFRNWIAETNPSKERSIAIEDMIRSVVDVIQGGLPTSEYVVDLAAKHVNKLKIQSVIADAEDLLAQDKIADAQASLANHTRIELGDELILPHSDELAWKEAFKRDEEKALIRYPGALGKFMHRAFQRGRLFSWMGPDKVGKSFWLLDAAYRAIKGGRRVAYFEVGDMSEGEVLQRLGTRAALAPFYAGTVAKPVDVDNGKVIFESVKYQYGLSGSEAFTAFKRRVRNQELLRLSCHPASTITVDGIYGMLEMWARQGWVTDVVVIDYADIIAPLPGYQDSLERIDQTWLHLRAMSQKLHCLVLTATQSSALAYKKKGPTAVLTREAYSGRKTKLAHVSGMLAINVSPQDKAQNVARINWVVYRHGFYNELDVVHVAGCPAIANPAVISWKQSFKKGEIEE